MLIICEKKIEIGFSQNDLLIRVRSVQLEFLLLLKTNFSPFRFISLKWVRTMAAVSHRTMMTWKMMMRGREVDGHHQLATRTAEWEE
jgi:hypothetical protein